ncbi:MAG: hypothetical protein Q9175_001448 [Cornicularia normoerica]
MDNATIERLRLNALHDEQLRRLIKAQNQKYEHRKRMLDLEHKSIHDAAIRRQKALNEQEYEQRERMLKLEHDYACLQAAHERVAGSGNAASGDEDSEE